MPCKVVMHQPPCTKAVYQYQASMLWINDMHQCHVSITCTNAMHQYRTPIPCTNTMHQCINVLYQCHASMPHINAMHQYHASIQMHQCHASILFTNAMHYCHASIPWRSTPYIWASMSRCPSVPATCFSALLLTCHALRYAPELSYCRSLCFTFSSPLKGQCHQMDIYLKVKTLYSVLSV